MKKILVIIIVFILSLSLSCCTNNESTLTTKIINTTKLTTTIKPTSTIKSTTTNRFKDDYTFTYFKNGVIKEEEIITNGVTLVKNTLYKTDNKKVIIYALEVDLNKVTIKAGTYNDETYNFSATRATPYSMATSYMNKTGKEVYAMINADFFGETVVNAFVKDGYIIKNAHNSNGQFDYTNLEADLPASAPMLFGIKGDTAQVKPIRSYSGDITDPTIKRKVVTSQLSYRIIHDENVISSSASLNFTTSKVILESNSVYATLDISGGATNMKVLNIKTIDNNTILSAPEEGRAYLYSLSKKEVEKNFMSEIEEGDFISLNVKSADGTWDGYTTILGCRQALIIDGEIASTVTLENSNGAQSNNVPRSAVGIKDDSTVVIFGVESMYYGGINKDGDSYGISLAELSEFMYYYNIKDGANFDGGGSTQLIVKKNNDFYAYVRSSDTGSINPIEQRKVMNSLLVVEK